MYGKSYESKFDGSMIGSGLAVFAVWDYMTTKARDGYVEVNPELLAFTLGGRDQDPKEIEDALDFLQQPDPKSRSKLEGGRRIIKEGQYQYRLVNWAEYNRIRTEEDRREYNRIKQAEYRAKKDAEISEMTPEEAKAFKKEYKKRRKHSAHVAACEGAQTAISHGLEEATPKPDPEPKGEYDP